MARKTRPQLDNGKPVSHDSDRSLTVRLGILVILMGVYRRNQLVPRWRMGAAHDHRIAGHDNLLERLRPPDPPAAKQGVETAYIRSRSFSPPRQILGDHRGRIARDSGSEKLHGNVIHSQLS